MTIPHTIKKIHLVTALAAVALTAGLLGPGLLAADDRDPTGRSPGSQTTPEDSSGTDATLPDGKHFGSISAAYVGPPELVFDDMELLVGSEARAAALADGVAADDIGDFHIRNLTSTARSLPVADDVVVTRVDCSGAGCVERTPTSYDDFTLSFDADRDGDTDAALGAGRVFWIVIESGHVIRIDEQYLP